MTRHGVEVFPSLVEAARAVREPEWRAKDEAREYRGNGGFRGYVPSPPRRLPRERVLKVLEMHKDGETTKGIARDLRMSPNTVRRIIREAA